MHHKFWSSWDQFFLLRFSLKNGFYYTRINDNRPLMSPIAILQKKVFVLHSFFSAGEWTQSLTLARKVIYHLNTLPALLFSFWDRISRNLPWLSSNSQSSCLCLLSNWDYTHGVHHHPQLESSFKCLKQTR
jgi:hypothetical protein